jgi:hypothetical protein
MAQDLPVGTAERLRRHFPRAMHAIVLVSGGVLAGLAYELSCRPWDVARKAVHADRLADPRSHSTILAVTRKVRDDGFLVLFRSPTHILDHGGTPHARLQTVLRTLARVGPWGVGFLVWEAFGPGLA